MSLWSKLKSMVTGKGDKSLAIGSNGISALFSQFGDNILAADTCVQAIDTIATEMKKLNLRHIRIRDGDGDSEMVNGSIQAVLKYPNPLMTKSDLMENITWNLYLNCNAFIYPVWEYSGTRRRLIAQYPLQPNQVDFLEDKSGKYFIRFHFNNGYEPVIPYEDVIHIRRQYYQNDFMGGNSFGQPNNGPLLKTLQLNETLLEGIAKALKASFAINGIVKYDSYIDDGEIEKNIKDFEAKVGKSESGFLGLDLKNEIIQLKRDLKVVDKDTLEWMDDKILRNFGTPVEIVRGKYTMEDYQAFYNRTLEDKVISISESYTKGMFRPGELATGNEIKLFPKELEFFSVEQKIRMIALLSPTGTLKENEKRMALGYAPDQELVGKRMVSLNYIDSGLADIYQTNMAKTGKKKEGSDEGTKKEDEGSAAE